MRSDSGFQLLFRESPVIILLAELFLRAEGFQVYSWRFDPLVSYLGMHWSLFVARRDYHEAFEVLVFLGYEDGFHDMNAMSVLLGRDLHELLPADKLASIQRLAAHLRVEETQQTLILLGVYLCVLVVWAFSIMMPHAIQIIIAFVIALLGMIPLWQSEKYQAALRGQLRAEALPEAEIVIELAQRKLCEYAVFLRNFSVLQKFLEDPRKVNPGLRVDPRESRIIEAIRYGARMPVVAMTDPKTAHIPIVGACRFAVQPDDEWIYFAAGILNGASLIVVDLKEMSGGLQIEVEMIQNCGLMSRTIFVIDRMLDTKSTKISINFNGRPGEGARVLSDSILEEWGLSNFIDAVEDIRKVYVESEGKTLESELQDDRVFCTTCGGVIRPSVNFCVHCIEKFPAEDNEQTIPLDHRNTDKFQDTPPEVTATCPACGHTWMGSWHVSFKDRQCPECGKRWRVLSK